MNQSEQYIRDENHFRLIGTVFLLLNDFGFTYCLLNSLKRLRPQILLAVCRASLLPMAGVRCQIGEN